MAIISSFPMGNSELAPLYQVSGLFPAFFQGDKAYESKYVGTAEEYRFGQTDTGGSGYTDDVTIYPARSMVAELTNSNLPAEQETITLDPGHVYRFLRTTGSSASYTVYKDGTAIFTETYPWDVYWLFSWTYNE